MGVGCWCVVCCFFFQAEDGIRDAQESRGLGDVYKRQAVRAERLQRVACRFQRFFLQPVRCAVAFVQGVEPVSYTHLTLPTIYSV